MNATESGSFQRYLLAKTSVDDRALNRRVWGALTRSLPPQTPQNRLRVLEVAAGIGNMVERLLAWGVLTHADYTAIDLQPENIAFARARLPEWTARLALSLDWDAEGGAVIADENRTLRLDLRAVDLFDFLPQARPDRAWDLLVAHAFLDLVDLPATLPRLLDTLSPGGCFYFSLNFDGLTVLEPVIDPDFDQLVLALYHQTMDLRTVGGRSSGDSHTGRRLFAHLRAAGTRILSAGSSDWVVYAGSDGYPGEEAAFLHYIVDTIQNALRGHPRLDHDRLADWVMARHKQIDCGELVYIAHQIDIAGTTAQVG